VFVFIPDDMSGGDRRHYAFVGFSGTTYEVIRSTPFGIKQPSELAGPATAERKGTSRQKKFSLACCNDAKGIFITTSEFHGNAREYAAGLHQKVILIDGRRLAELMIEHGIGVAEEHAYSIKKINSDYFDESES
jgi:hypothetical protein